MELDSATEQRPPRFVTVSRVTEPPAPPFSKVWRFAVEYVSDDQKRKGTYYTNASDGLFHPGDRFAFIYPPKLDGKFTILRLGRTAEFPADPVLSVKEPVMNELIHIATGTIGDNTIPTVLARDLHAFLEVRKDFSDWIKVQLEIFTQGRDFEVFPFSGENPGTQGFGGRPRTEYVLTIECGKHIAMMSRTEKGRQARDYFIECERRVKNPVAQIVIPKTLPEALRLAAKLAEEKDAAEERAVFAEETKSWIGSRREATAMNKAAIATKKANRLEKLNNELKIELDLSNDYASVKRMEAIHRKSFDWRPLKKASAELGYEIHHVFDANYASVNAYHREVWKEVYDIDISEEPKKPRPTTRPAHSANAHGYF